MNRLNSIYSKMRMSTLSREEFLEAVERRRHSEYSPPECARVNTLRHSLFAENKARSAGSAVLVCFVRAFQKHSASEPNNGKQQLHVLLTQRFQKEGELFYPITNGRTFLLQAQIFLVKIAIAPKALQTKI